MKRTSGTSLPETVVGLFLLTMGFLLVVQLYQAALGYTQQAEERSRAALVCQNVLDEQRALLANGAYNFHEDNFSNLNSIQAPGGGLYYDVNFEDVTVGTPCSAYSGYFPSYYRMEGSAKTLRVEVRNSANDVLCEASTLLVDRFRPAGSDFDILVSPASPSPLSQNGTVELTANATLNGQPLDDASFSWTLAPQTTGTGTLEVVPGSGSTTARFTHAINLAGAGLEHSPSGTNAVVVVRARYRGRVSELSVRIVLL